MRQQIRAVLRASALASLASATIVPGISVAQDAASESGELEELVVTGTRVTDRTRLDSLAPVDVLSAETLTRQGSTELAQALSTVAPSLNFPRPAITDGTDHIRPATLRGLAPDQTLVLVNSKRRHQSALVNVNGSVGRGSAAVDLNAIPLAAIKRIEVLRDGASAQYGSDALAGVVNIQLRDDREGGAASVTYGQYRTTVETDRGRRDESDGTTITMGGWAGFGLGADGHLTLSAEFRDRDPTSRGDVDQRVTPRVVTSRFGDPESKDLSFYVNAGLPVSDTWELYGWAGYQQRDGSSAAFPRIFNDARNVPAIYPNGFLPLIESDIGDLTLAAGARGALFGWDADFSVVYGKNELDYRTENSLNTSYGAASQTSFDAGGLEYDQVVLNLGLVRGFDVGLAAPLNVATGIEARREGYAIRAGEPTSYNRGPITTAPVGAQGFPGFLPSNVLDEDRDAIGAYVDVEAQFTERLLASAAARFEDYSDFGSNVTGKVAARFDFTESFALRGAVSTGFRAPGLQQAFFSSTATNFINGIPFEIGTFPATSPTAVALGAKPLEAEESRNYSLGAVFRVGDFEATIDAYRIDIDDRIVLSENLGGRADIDALLAPFNVGRARFFLNGVETTTEGIDVVVRYTRALDSGAKFEFTSAANFNSTEVTKLPTLDVVSQLPLGPVPLFDRINVLTFEEGTPSSKISFGVDYSKPTSWGDIGVGVSAIRYGKVTEPGTSADGSRDWTMDSETVVDLEARFGFGEKLELTVGIDNVFDEYPAPLPVFLNATGALGFSRYSPMGFNGRYPYLRATYNW